MNEIKRRLHKTLRWSERFMQVDMVYLARGNFWLFIGRIVASGGGFVLTYLFANLLSPEKFGTYKYILASAGIIGAMTLNGMGSAVLRSVGKGYFGVIRPAFRFAFLTSLPASAVALFVSGYYLYKANVVLGVSLFVIALLNPLITSLGISKALFVANGDFKNATYYNSLRTIFQITPLALVLLLTDNVLIIASTFFCVSAGVGYATFRMSLQKLSAPAESTHLPETIAYAKHLSVLGFFQLITAQLDQFLLWHFSGPAAVATYSIAQGPSKELRAVADNISTIALPKILERKPEAAAISVRINSFKITIVYVALALAYIVSAPVIFELIFPQYTDAIFPSQILALVFVLQARGIADNFLFAHSSIRDRYLVTIPPLIIKIVMFAILIPLYGTLGAVASLLLSELCMSAIVWYLFRKHLK